MNIKKSLISLLLCLPLLSCQTARYTDTASCRFLAEEVRGVLPQEKFAELGEDALALVLEDREQITDHCLLYSLPSENIDELGILKAKDETDAKEILRMIEEYLQAKRTDDATFIASYAPRELPKLEDAEASRFGTYVVYAILDREGREAVMQTVQDALKIEK